MKRNERNFQASIPQVVFTKNREATFPVFDLSKMSSMNKGGIYFEDALVEANSYDLLRKKCPICLDSIPYFDNYKTLRKHLKDTHKLFFWYVFSDEKRAAVGDSIKPETHS